MLLRVGAESLRARRPAALWPICALFSLLVLTGHAHLDQRPFAALLIAVALVNVAIAATRRPALSRTLLLSQSSIAVATVAAVVLYLLRYVGTAPEVLRVLLDFVRSSLVAPWTYLRFLIDSLVLVVPVTLALLALSAYRGRRPGKARLLATLYAASAVNLACDYAVRRPLFQVSGEPDATGFFFSAGLFGLESSLPLYLLLLAACVITCRRLSDSMIGDGP